MADGQNIGAQMGVLARKLARARGQSADFDAGLAGLGLDTAAADIAPFDDAAGSSAAPSVPPHVRAWRLALARAARDQLKMTVGFSDVTLAQVSLTEVLETPMQRALILMLQGKGEGMGLMVLSGQMLAAMVEILTLTHLSPHVPDEGHLRKPTRTDAAMAVEFIDAALSGFEAIAAESGGADWATGYRYAAFIDDPRPLHLMLEDGEYHLLSADLVLEDGSRTGKISLALPVIAAAAALPDFALMDFAADATVQAAPPEDDHFQADLAQVVQDLPATIDGALAQIALPIERILRLAVGEVIPLPLANLDQISVIGMDGLRVAGARLGQNRGMRALRLTDVATARKSADTAPMGQHQPQGFGLASHDLPPTSLPAPLASTPLDGDGGASPVPLAADMHLAQTG